MHHTIIAVVFLFTAATEANNCQGCLNLDEYNFDKVLRRFRAVMVKFDVAYPYGDKHDAFTTLAEEVSSNEDIILAEVGVKDYGEKENEVLALKYGVGKDDLPSIRLFVQGKPEPVPLLQSDGWTLNTLRNLITDNTDIYVGLPGCLEQFDKLAMKFVASDDKAAVLNEAEGMAELLTDKNKETATIYLKFMRKIVNRGDDFVGQERTRLLKILKEGKINDKKKTELSNHLNILKAFSLPQKDEL